MAITFHCDHCGKKIEASENAAGKWGKCPSCHNKIYVPNLEVNVDDLKFAPINEEEEKRKQKLLSETFALEQEILEEKEKPEEDGKVVMPDSVEQIGFGEFNDDKLYNIIIRYLRRMADGQLEEAKKDLSTIKASGDSAYKLLDRIALADIPEAELSDVPPQVLAGLIRTLRSEIS